MTIWKNSRFANTRVDNNTSFMSVDLLSIATERPRIMARLVSNVSELLQSGKLSPLTAFKVLQSGNVGCKLVVVPQAKDVVKVCCPLFVAHPPSSSSMFRGRTNNFQATPSSKKTKLLR